MFETVYNKSIIFVIKNISVNRAFALLSCQETLGFILKKAIKYLQYTVIN